MNNTIKNIFLFTILVSVIAVAMQNANAKVFTIQNESVNMFVVNDTTGNILLNPNTGFGNVGIGMASPASLLQAAGTFNATSSSTQMLLNSNGGVTINLKG